MKTTQLTLSLATAGLLAASAQAGTITPVLPPQDGEASHADIFEDIFGGPAFVQSGNDFSNGAVDLTRVDDDDDQTYNFLRWSAEILAAHAFADQGFGTSAGQLINIAGKQYDAASGNVAGPGSADLEFARFGNMCDTIDVTTNPADNPNGRDHVVTYSYTEQNQTYYILFFEDANETSDFTDWDYNDLVVRISGENVPEPGSLALMGLGAAAMLRRRR